MTALIFLLTFMLFAGSAQAEDALAGRAAAKRAAAERALEAGRAERLEARAKLNRAIQEAEARLQAARADAERAKRLLEERRAADARSKEDAGRIRRVQADLRRLLGQAGELEPGLRGGEPEALVERVAVGVEARLERLERSSEARVERATVLDRDGRASSARVLRLGPLMLADGAPAATGFLREQDGTLQVVGPMLDAEQKEALRDASVGRSGRVPVDVDGALTRVPAEPPARGTSRLSAGGVFVWPIIAVGLLGLLLFAERFLYLVLRPARAGQIEAVAGALQRGERMRAEAVVGKRRTDLERVLWSGVHTIDRPRAVREQALETALLREEPRLERGVALIGAVAGLAPLLGLLGTVTGMISTFDVISTFGTGNPRLLSGGISVALITTQLGLVVAVPALLAHAFVSRAVARRQALLEEARTALLALPDGRSNPGIPPE